jgi:hypothetical protein
MSTRPNVITVELPSFRDTVHAMRPHGNSRLSTVAARDTAWELGEGFISEKLPSGKTPGQTWNKLRA